MRLTTVAALGFAGVALASPAPAVLQERDCTPAGRKNYCDVLIDYQDSKGNIIKHQTQSVAFDNGGTIAFYGSIPGCTITVLRNCSGCLGWAVATRTPLRSTASCSSPNFFALATPFVAIRSTDLGIMPHASSATYAASTSLAKLREALGEPVASSLRYVPLDKLITKPQKHESDAIPFMLLFGHVRQQWKDNMQEVWILLYPPQDEEGKSKVCFRSYDDAIEEEEWHDGQNISSTAECAAAFKMPKKASLSKHVALARYYFLEKLAAEEARNNGVSELEFPLVVNKVFLDGLKLACREFENEAKSTPAGSDRQPRTSLVPAMNSQSSDTTIIGDSSQQRFYSKVQHAREVPTPAASRTPGETGRGTRTRAPHQQDAVEVLAELYEKEMTLQADTSDLNDQLLALTEARLELERKRRELEEQRQKNEEEIMNIETQREELFKGLSSKDAFELGRTVERSHNAKRRKID